MTRPCIRCHNYPAIDNSHVVPNFFTKKLKAESPFPFLIHSDDLSGVEQDGWKTDFLCGDPTVKAANGGTIPPGVKSCEQLVGATETWFASHVFHPVMNGTTSPVTVTDDLFRFVASLAFRAVQWTEDRRGAAAAAHLKPLFHAALAAFDGSTTHNLHFYGSALHPVTADAKWAPGVNGYFLRVVQIFSILGCVDYSMTPINNVVVKGPRFVFVITDVPLENFGTSELGRLTLGSTFDLGKNMTGLVEFLRSVFNEKALEIEGNWKLLPQHRQDKIVAKAAAPAATTTAVHSWWEYDNELAAFHEAQRK